MAPKTASSEYLPWAMLGGCRRPGLNSNEERGAEMDEMWPLVLQEFLRRAVH